MKRKDAAREKRLWIRQVILPEVVTLGAVL